MTVYGCPQCRSMLDPVLRGMQGETMTGYVCRACGYRDARPEDQNWMHSEIECSVCSHEWVAVYEDGTAALECPGCGYMNSVPA